MSLVESQVKRGARASNRTNTPVKVDLKVSKISYDIDYEVGKLRVLPSFVLNVASEAGSEDTSHLLIAASFALDYLIEPAAEFPDDSLQAFAATNGVFNAWPYWREYVQNTCVRMGLPAITVPVFRIA